MRKKPEWRIWLKDKKECKAWLNLYTRRKILRSSADESGLYIKKTEHNMNLANWILEKHADEIPKMFGTENFYDWIVNIYYYAIYHAALALVSKNGYKSDNHSATICFLTFHYYHMTKQMKKEDIETVAISLSKEDIETIGVSKSLRERASYDVHEIFEKSIASDTRTKAINFVRKVREILS